MKCLKIFLLILILLSSISRAQEVEVASAIDQNAKPYEGFAVFQKNFINKLDVSQAEGNAVNIKLKFVIDVDGSFTDINVSDNKYDLGKQIILTLKKMPKWKPAYSKGKPVRSFFSMPIIIEADLNQEFDVTLLDKKLEKVEIETQFFKFACNCIAGEQEVYDNDSKFEFEYFSNTGKYRMTLFKQDEISFQQFDKYQKDYLESRQVKTEQIEYLGVNSSNYDQFFEIPEGDFYAKNRMFYKDGFIYMLFYMSKDKAETERTFDELLQSFQIKQ